MVKTGCWKRWRLLQGHTGSRSLFHLVLFASGAESRVVEELPQVEQVVGPRETVRFIISGKVPAGFQPGGEGNSPVFGGRSGLCRLIDKTPPVPGGCLHRGADWLDPLFYPFCYALLLDGR